MKTRGTQLAQFALSLCLAAGLSIAAAAQTPPSKPHSSPKPRVDSAPRVTNPPLPTKTFPRAPIALPEQTTEKSFAVDPSVSLRLCVTEGRVKINGWDRDEVRIFVKDGTRFQVKVLEKDSESGKPIWLLIANQPPATARRGQVSECLSGESIELDVPRKAGVTLKGRVTQTSVDSIRKIHVENVEGNITLRNITGGISARTHQGGVMVENSGGAISLESGTGNIAAYAVSPGQVGDLFKAKTTSGTISLRYLDHRQIEANSITGSVLFNGKFLPGGLYNFKTSNGAIRLLIPGNSSFTIKATYGFGAFDSELPLNFRFHNVENAKTLEAVLGSGEANVNLFTTSGSIGIRRQEKN